LIELRLYDVKAYEKCTSFLATPYRPFPLILH